MAVDKDVDFLGVVIPSCPTPKVLFFVIKQAEREFLQAGDFLLVCNSERETTDFTDVDEVIES